MPKQHKFSHPMPSQPKEGLSLVIMIEEEDDDRRYRRQVYWQTGWGFSSVPQSPWPTLPLSSTAITIIMSITTICPTCQ